MREIVMQSESSVTCSADVTNQIRDLMERMDSVDYMADGFSDCDESSENEDSVYQPVSKHTQEIIQTEKRLLHTLGLTNGLFERHVPLKVYKGKKVYDKYDIHAHVRPKSTGTTHHDKKAETHSEKMHQDRTNHEKGRHQEKEHHSDKMHHEHSQQHEKSRVDVQNPTQDTHHEPVYENIHNHENTHHLQNSFRKGNHEKSHREIGHHNKVDNDNDTFDRDSMDSIDEAVFETILAGQSGDLLHLPIMSPPTEEQTQHSRLSSSYYSRPMSFNFLLAGETLTCNFDQESYKSAAAGLLSGSDKDSSPACFCSSCNVYDDIYSGWDAPQKGNKTKLGRRRKPSTNAGSSDIAFNRLTQTMGKDPVIFHHYKDNKKYIERYRFYHTVGNVGRPLSYTKYAERGVENDPYYCRMKSNITSISSQFYGLSHLRDEIADSASSGGSAHERVRSDDESMEGSSVEVKPYSMRDRGKALNLAPVRECTVPNLRPTDKIDIMQLNQYLNLTTPPVPTNCLQFDLEDVKTKRYGSHATNSSDSNLFPASTPRRGVRTLRLGSAEFVKPGTPDSQIRWNSEKRGTSIYRPSSTLTTSVNGNLIVGSTVSSPVPPNATRAKNGGKMSAYVQFQKERTLTPSTPPHQVSGQKFKACERVSDLSSKERGGKFSYTHAAHGERRSPAPRNTTTVDFRETYIPRDRSRTITLDVNHLGIRGQPYKQREQMVLYKNRRAQIMRS